MTKQEAIQQMEEGVKITHNYFASDEWMTIKNGKILTEEGYSHDIREFWLYRTGNGFEDGYSVWQS